MKKISFLKAFRQAGFAGIELVLLITMVAGVLAAARLARQPQNLQPQAATTGKWLDDNGAECIQGSSYGSYDAGAVYLKYYYQNDNCTGYFYYLVAPQYECSKDGSGICVKRNGKINNPPHNAFYSIWFSDNNQCSKSEPTPVPPGRLPFSAAIKFCKWTIGQSECEKNGNYCVNDPANCGVNDIPKSGGSCSPNNNTVCCKRFTPSSPTPSSPSCNGIPPNGFNSSKCYKKQEIYDSIGIWTTKCQDATNEAKCNILQNTFSCNCQWGTAGDGEPTPTTPPGGGYTPPPDGPPGGGYDGQACGVYSNTKCSGLKVGDICDGSTTCTTDGSKGIDDNLICKCNTGGGGNGPPPSGYACSSLTLDKTSFKPNETTTLTATSNEESTDFFFVLYNTLTGQPACVAQGGDVTTDVTGCPTGTHKLIFKDANTASRLTGTRSLTLNDVNLKDMFIWQPNGGYLRYLTFKAFMAKGGGAWTAENPACNQNAEIYRPAVCVNSSIDKNTLNPGESLNITLNGQSPAGTSISKYTAAFYNMDNLYGPGNPKPILFAGSHYSISSDSGTINIKYDDLNKADENNNNQLPVNISANGYFHLNDGGFSQADPNCVEQFNIVRADGSITPTPSDLTPTPSDLTPTPSDLTPTPSDMTPTPSDPTPSPTPTEDWWAPDGKKCDGINFISLNSDPLCNVPVGYITDSEEINGGGENKCVSGKPCYKAGGVIIDPGEEAKFQSRSDVPDSCDALEPGNLPPGTVYDQLLNCSYREAPKGNIQVKVKVSWENEDGEEDKAKVSEERP